MANYEATKYAFSGTSLTGIQGVNTGLIVPWGSSSVPSGFLECGGSAVSRTTYADLFAVVGTTYGVGDGSTTFNVPNLTDRLAVSKSPSLALGSTGGANTVVGTGNIGGSIGSTVLTAGELAAHTHTSGAGTGTGAGANFDSDSSPNATANPGTAISINPSGGGGGHDHPMAANFVGGSNSTLQPYLTVMYIIKT